jgi:hypothetical protein
MAEPVSGISVTVDDDPDNSVRVDEATGTIERDQEDGSVVVQLDARRPKKDGDEDKFYANLADDIDAQRLAVIANELHDAISADDRSRGNWLALRARAMDFLGLEIKEPSSSTAGSSSEAVEGLSTVTNPLLLEACLKAWANAQAELLPSEGPCKIDETNTETTPIEDELAETLERDTNYFLTTIATEYYPETSHMLLWGNIFGGSGFKKVYRCPMKRRPTAPMVAAQNLIVSDTMKDLRSCERITHQIEMRPSIMKRMRLLGAYRDSAPLPQPTPQPNEVQAKIAAQQGTQAVPQRQEDQPYTLWECQCELDLPDYAPAKFKDKGIPLPYLVTMDKDSKEILAVRRDWHEEDEECERKRMYVKYPYVPGPGFYGTGLMHILGNASQAMTMAWRLCLDMGAFANFPSGLISKLGGRQNTSDIRLSPGTLQPIETGDKPINQVVAPLPYHDITGGMLALMEQITAQAGKAGGVTEIPTAEGIQNVPVGTMLAQIEQATKVVAASHKGMHQAQAEELQMIVDLFREYPEDFWRNNKFGKDYWNEQKLLQALSDYDLVPRSDPNTPSHIHRIARALGLVQLSAMPQFMQIMDVNEVLDRALRAMGENPEGIIKQAPAAAPQPNPQLIAAMAKSKDADTKQLKVATDVQNAQQQADIKQKELASKQAIETTKLSEEMLIHGHDAQKAQQELNHSAWEQHRADQQHGLDVAKHVHDKNVDLAQLAIDAHEATKPEPKPDSSKKK